MVGYIQRDAEPIATVSTPELTGNAPRLFSLNVKMTPRSDHIYPYPLSGLYTLHLET